MAQLAFNLLLWPYSACLRPCMDLPNIGLVSSGYMDNLEGI